MSENTNLYNILSTLISNQFSLYSKISGNNQDIFYVESFDENPSISGLYINYDGESRYWNGTDWEYVSKECSNVIDSNSTSGTIPTSKAVYDYVNSKTSGSVSDGTIIEINHDISQISESLIIVTNDLITVSGDLNTVSGDLITVSGDLNTVTNNLNTVTSNLNTVSGDLNTVSGDLNTVSGKLNDYLLKDDIKSEIHYSNTLPQNGTTSGLYINAEGQSKLWVNNSWIDISKELSNTINASSTSGTVPTTKAVYDFVSTISGQTSSGGVQEVFYISTFEGFTPSVSGLYIDSDGQSKFWNSNSNEWEDLSVKTTDIINENDINNISGYVTTVKAVYDFVSTISGQTSSGGVQEIFYIPTFEGFTPSVSGLYIDSDGQTKYYDGENWGNTSIEVVNTINTSSTSGTVPSTKSVYDFVSTISGQILSSSGSSGGVQEVFYISTFEDFTPSVSGLYIDSEGQSKFWNGSEYEDLSVKTTDIINENDINNISGYVTTAKAVYDFVSTNTSGFILKSEISSHIPNEIVYIDSFDNYTPSSAGLYIDSYGQTKYYDGENWENISNEISDEVNANSTSGTIPTSKAVFDFISSISGQFSSGSGSSSSGSSSDSSVQEVFYISTFEDFTPSVSGLYIDSNGQSKFWNGSEYEELSVKTTDVIDEDEINNISGYVPTSQAVYDYINERNFGLSRTWQSLTDIVSGSYEVIVGNGFQQKIILSGDLTLNPPALNSKYYSLILQITKSADQTVSINSNGNNTTILSGSEVGTYHIKWFFDGENTYRYEPYKVYLDLIGGDSGGTTGDELNPDTVTSFSITETMITKDEGTSYYTFGTNLTNTYQVYDDTATGTNRYWVNTNTDLYTAYLKYDSENGYWGLYNEDYSGIWYKTTDSNPFTSTNWVAARSGTSSAGTVTVGTAAKITFENYEFSDGGGSTDTTGYDYDTLIAAGFSGDLCNEVNGSYDASILNGTWSRITTTDDATLQANGFKTEQWQHENYDNIILKYVSDSSRWEILIDDTYIAFEAGAFANQLTPWDKIYTDGNLATMWAGSVAIPINGTFELKSVTEQEGYGAKYLVSGCPNEDYNGYYYLVDGETSWNAAPVYRNDNGMSLFAIDEALVARMVLGSGSYSSGTFSPVYKYSDYGYVENLSGNWLDSTDSVVNGLTVQLLT